MRYPTQMVGSVWWRIRNYGLIASLKYTVSALSFKQKIKSYELETLDLNGFLKLFGVKEEDFNGFELDSKDAVRQCVSELRTGYSGQLDSMKPVLESSASTARLIALYTIIAQIDIKTVIETGTQYGVSSSFVGKSSRLLERQIQIYTFDVVNLENLPKDKDVNYIVLPKPTRKSFKEITIRIINAPVLFFHDSDHTYENMYFEFTWAWKVLKVAILLSDDIDMNSAFDDFCMDNNLLGKKILIDEGPILGLIVRSAQPK